MIFKTNREATEERWYKSENGWNGSEKQQPDNDSICKTDISFDWKSIKTSIILKIQRFFFSWSIKNWEERERKKNANHVN